MTLEILSQNTFEHFGIYQYLTMLHISLKEIYVNWLLNTNKKGSFEWWISEWVIKAGCGVSRLVMMCIVHMTPNILHEGYVACIKSDWCPFCVFESDLTSFSWYNFGTLDHVHRYFFCNIPWTLSYILFVIFISG